MTYGISHLVEDLRAARAQAPDEDSMLAAAQVAVGKVMADGSWMQPNYREYDEELRYGDVLLHQDDDHSYCIYLILERNKVKELFWLNQQYGPSLR